MTITSFDVWTVDEPEFIEDTKHKLDVLTHSVRMAMGTGGKNNHLAKEGLEILADWALHKLFVACAKVLWWAIWIIIKRILKRIGDCIKRMKFWPWIFYCVCCFWLEHFLEFIKKKKPS